MFRAIIVIRAMKESTCHMESGSLAMVSLGAVPGVRTNGNGAAVERMRPLRSIASRSRHIWCPDPRASVRSVTPERTPVGLIHGRYRLRRECSDQHDIIAVVFLSK